MSTTPAKPNPELAAIAAQVPDLQNKGLESFDVKGSEGYSEKLVDAIEMIGEETAAGMPPPAPHSEVTPGMRYLHCSRTIHQLVTDRNRAVGIYMGVASLLITASSFIYQARPQGDLIVPFDKIQRWCLPIAFGALAVLAVFIAFLLIRTRIGLIYEVAKMNALLGLPVGRVSRIQPLSIAFILQAIVSIGGGASAALFSVYMMFLANPQIEHPGIWATLIGLVITAALILLYVLTVSYTTSDQRLQSIGK
ncbi:MAG: hypothetical protein HY040_27935 [Planctomycetes bacterium]|nr:hypothetical protein [Planctomycetota bacterium]